MARTDPLVEGRGFQHDKLNQLQCADHKRCKHEVRRLHIPPQPPAADAVLRYLPLLARKQTKTAAHKCAAVSVVVVVFLVVIPAGDVLFLWFTQTLSSQPKRHSLIVTRSG